MKKSVYFERSEKEIEHVHRMKPDAIPKIALHWTTDGKNKPGQPKETWKKSAEDPKLT